MGYGLASSCPQTYHSVVEFVWCRIVVASPPTRCMPKCCSIRSCLNLLVRTKLMLSDRQYQTTALTAISTDRSKAVVPVLVLLFVALWFILRGDLFYVLHCVILFLRFFSPFSIVITSLGEERANLNAFRTFVPFALVGFCLFTLLLGVWEGRRFVIVALPGLFSYLFCFFNSIKSLLTRLHR